MRHKIQIHSDIHLEKYPHRRLRSIASTLILAGDIGVPLFPSYRNFFRDTSRQFDQIVYVLGNHEYERTWMGLDRNNYHLLQDKFNQRTVLIQEIISEFKNIHLLHNELIVLHNKKIFGSTLWTNYHQRKSNNPLSVTEQFLTQQHFIALPRIQQCRPDILITHYVSNRSVLTKPWNIGLGPSNCIPAPVAIFGHIHYSISNNNNIFCNPWGENKEANDIVFELE